MIHKEKWISAYCYFSNHSQCDSKSCECKCHVAPELTKKKKMTPEEIVRYLAKNPEKMDYGVPLGEAIQALCKVVTKMMDEGSPRP